VTPEKLSGLAYIGREKRLSPTPHDGCNLLDACCAAMPQPLLAHLRAKMHRRALDLLHLTLTQARVDRLAQTKGAEAVDPSVYPILVQLAEGV
jgi:hypothetical protein